jgi:hypothetical protein
VLVAALIIAAMNWPARVWIEADVVTRRAVFHAPPNVQRLLSSTPVQSLSLSRFDSVTIPAGNLEAADPARRNLTDLSWPPEAWRTVSMNESLSLHPLPGREAGISIITRGASSQPLTLNSLAAASADITLTSPERDIVALDVAGGEQQGSAQLPDEAEITLENCDCAGTTLGNCAGAVTLRLRAAATDTMLRFSSQGRGIYAQFRFAPGGLNLLPDRDFTGSRPEFRDLDEGGNPVSTISGESKVLFADYPNTPPVIIPAERFLDFDHRFTFYIRSVSAADDRKNLRIAMGGSTQEVDSGLKGSVRNRMPTWFDLLWKNPSLVALLAIITWLVPVLIGARKLLGEFNEAK